MMHASAIMFRIPCVLAVALLGAVTPAGAEEETAVDIEGRRELFVDRHLIEDLNGTTLRLHTPVPAETVFQFDKPWEGLYCGYVTVLKAGDTFRLYYRGLPESKADGSNLETTCCAESADGIHWTRPSLGLFEVAGMRDNNVILSGMAPFSHNFAPFVDARPGVAAEARYKALAGTSKSGLAAFASADGLRWKKLREQPVLTEGAFDSQNVAFWSEAEGCYVCYFRTWTEGGFGGVRTVSRATSPDFLHWSDPAPMAFGDTPIEHLYTNQTRPYFRAPHIYIAIAARFMPGRRVVTTAQFEALGGQATYSGDCSDTVFMTSRGGNAYDRTFMESFVRPGIGLSNWTSRTNYPAYGVVPTADAEMSMYVQRNYGQPTHHLQRLALRTDGFVSVNAPYAGGEVQTKPMRFHGEELRINYSTSAAGSIWVEIQDAAGTPLPGFSREDSDEIIGDEIERVVTWKGKSDVGALSGRPVRVRFIMKDADLYSIRFQ